MIWTDSGIVLSNRKLREDLKIVSIFTKEHGRISAISKIINRNAFSLFSNVTVDLVKKNASDDMGFWTKKYEKQNWIHVFHEEVSLLICQSICLILDKVLPIGVRFSRAFSLLAFMLENISKLSIKELLMLYTYFEFVLLDESGFSFDLEYCAICGQKEEIEFISPKTGRTASKKCSFSHKEKLFEIPNIWNVWRSKKLLCDLMNQSFSFEDLLNSMNITWYFITKNILDFQNHFRNVLISRVFDVEKRFSE